MDRNTGGLSRPPALERAPLRAARIQKREGIADMFMQTTHRDAERQCLMFCRPIRTGFGELAVRPLGPADAGMAQAFVISLSGTSRYFRFFQVLKCLSPAMLDRFTRADQVTQVALAAVADLDGRPSMVAEARYAVAADGRSAEFALAVADEWQRRGLATQLMATLEHIAAAAGITRLMGECLAINQGFVSLARSLGYRVRADAGDRSLLRIEKDTRGDRQRRGAKSSHGCAGGLSISARRAVKR
ncbi:MAG TPA: GNAT family N-acetyltransferase [Hyphomicrobiaceae bacterium]|nr:GNAT family N-acetyltransferase [Hyphomicrobiaceae bacterium]